MNSTPENNLSLNECLGNEFVLSEFPATWELYKKFGPHIKGWPKSYRPDPEGYREMIEEVKELCLALSPSRGSEEEGLKR